MSHYHHDSNHNHHHPHQITNNIKIAFFLNFSFALIEIVGGVLTNSLAIISDAIHDLGDSLSLGFAWYLENNSHKPGDTLFSYGYRRLSLLAALINTLILSVGSLYVIFNAIPRILNPEVTDASGMIYLAILGIIINGFAVLKMSDFTSLNAKVVTWHLLEDVLGWVAVLIVSIILWFTDLYILDPILSLLISAYIFYNAIGNLSQTTKIFLQAVPSNIDLQKLETNILALDKVNSIHHTHIWSLDGEHHVLTTHVVVLEDTSREEIQSIKNTIKELGRSLNLEHITLEMEYLNEYCSLR